MRWTIEDIPDLTGKTAVVTGANGGPGLESAKALAGTGAHVVMGARDQEKAQAALAEITEQHPEAALEIVELDLGSLDSVRAAAATIRDSHSTIDILINNAGLMALPERRTGNGFEMQFGVNHLGHWALTAQLLPALLHSEAARVVTVTSTARHMGRPVDPDNPKLEGRYKPWLSYGQSKLANYHFAIGLQREFAEHGARTESFSAHPGFSNTNLQVHTVEQGGGGVFGELSARHVARSGMSASEGALPQLRAATDPTAKGGELYAPRFVGTGVPVRRPVLRRVGLGRAIDELWAVSERETGVSLDVGAALNES
ncbi:MAG: oxidoreductase [Actinomycetota bacterium]